LNGDRHVIRYAPDGRLLIVFRDYSPLSFRKDLAKISEERKETDLSLIAGETGQGSPTEGDWAGWVGTYDDLLKRNDGQYRIRFKTISKVGIVAIPEWNCFLTEPSLQRLTDIGERISCHIF